MSSKNSSFDWREVDSHFCSKWNLCQDRSFSPLVLESKIDQHLAKNDDCMVAETLMFKSFLNFAPFEGEGERNPKKALEILDEADAYVATRGDGEKETGYGLVSCANRMWIVEKISAREHQNLKSKLKELQKNQSRQTMAYVHSTRAYALSRLGGPRQREGVSIFAEALEIQPENTHWLFGKALLVGRIYRILSGPIGRDGTFLVTNEIKHLREQEAALLDKILALDPSYNLAVIYRAINYHHCGKRDVAMRLVQRFEEDNDNLDVTIRLKMAEVCRKSGFLEAAVNILEAIRESDRSAEIYHQLGVVKRWYYNDSMRSNSNVNSRDILQDALRYFQKACEVEEHHKVARLQKACTLAELGKNDESRQEFMKLKTECADNAHETYHTLKAIQKLQKYDTFTPEERLENLKSLVEICVKHYSLESIDSRHAISFDKQRRVVISNAHREIRSYQNSHNINLRFLASSTLAWVKFYLKDYGASSKMFEITLGFFEPRGAFKLSDRKGDYLDVLKGLIMCHINLKRFSKAKESLQKLKQADDDDDDISDLEADLCLEEAKFKLECNENWDLIEPLLQMAVSFNSLEGCFLLLMNYRSREIWSVEVMTCLSSIQKNLESQASSHRHGNFDLNKDNCSNTDSKEAGVQERLRKYFNGCLREHPNLAELRNSYLEFISERNHSVELNWKGNMKIRDVSKNTLKIAREALDKAFNRIQAGLHRPAGGGHTQSNYPCIYDWPRASTSKKKGNEGGKVDQTQAEVHLKKFLKDHLSPEQVPSDLFELLLKEQPRYSKENNWLVALCKLAGQGKHASDEFEEDICIEPGQRCDEGFYFKVPDLVTTAFENVQRIVLELDKWIQRTVKNEA